MIKNPKLRLALADRNIIVDLDQYTADKAFDLFDKVAQIRIKTSPFTKYPKEEGESTEQWRERVSKEAEKDAVRREGEEVEVHLKRIFDAKHEMYNLAFEILNAICETFGASPLTESQFKSVNWLNVKKFIYDVLSTGDISCSDFYNEEIK